ncbi:protein GUCD1 isoform X2 [Lingula anatina]|uniref:Protein GUCD1 isoform X2 n=1 Tax=Lingula anatina TaxID=7574 RepID=A0A1S3JXH6_LINAN|nr:protein GUCD1 isoform X2 [Lingula anatina]|eukprot:XP_013414766.1 protein GUCD1 isoform X2 [Lingula anatina]
MNADDTNVQLDDQSLDHVVDVPHEIQLYTWDCGLACVKMVLKHYSVNMGNFLQVCKELQFGESVWTIDLANILALYRVEHHFYTVTLGVDKGYSGKAFYRAKFSSDETRVNNLFQDAQYKGIPVSKGTIDADAILNHLTQNKVLIVLTDWNILKCLHCDKSCTPSLHCFGSLIKTYQGHFIVVVGFNLKQKLIYYKNPAYDKEMCCCTMKNFEKARKSYGTDEDIIFVYGLENSVS